MSEFTKKIEALFENKIGLSVNAVGHSVVQRAVAMRMANCGISDTSEYVRCLECSEHELGELTELVIVSETRFFRNAESFEFLKNYLMSDWLSQNTSQMLRILSVPCSSGEEPYSMVIALTDAGFPYHKLHIDAADISLKLLNKAEKGIYGRESFRDKEPPFDKRYYHVLPNGYQLTESVRQKVRWIKGNLSDSGFLKNEMPYHIVFCRNLMIYFNYAARLRGVENIFRLLEDQGLLFVGHAEHAMFSVPKLTRIMPSQAFVFRKDRTEDHRPVIRGASVNELPKTPEILPDSPIAEQESVEPPIQASIETVKLYADRGNLKQAAELCKIYLAANPTDAEAHFLMGLVMKARKDDLGAEQWLSKALYLDPQHEDALHYLAVILEKRGEIGAANQLKQRYERAKEMRSEK